MKCDAYVCCLLALSSYSFVPPVRMHVQEGQKWYKTAKMHLSIRSCLGDVVNYLVNESVNL